MRVAISCTRIPDLERIVYKASGQLGRVLEVIRQDDLVLIACTEEFERWRSGLPILLELETCIRFLCATQTDFYVREDDEERFKRLAFYALDTEDLLESVLKECDQEFVHRHARQLRGGKRLERIERGIFDSMI